MAEDPRAARGGWMGRLAAGLTGADMSPEEAVATVEEVRRRREHARVVASAAQIDVGDKASKAQVKRRESWQEDCWDVFDTIGEVKYGTGYLGNALSKVRLYVGLKPDDPDADPQPLADALDVEGEPPVSREVAATAQGILDRLGPGQGDMLRELGINLTVAGECYLWGRDETADGKPPPKDVQPGPDGIIPTEIQKALDSVREVWDVRSVDEVTTSNDDVHVTDSPTEVGSSKGREVTDDDMLIRIWNKHPRYSSLPDSPLRGVLSSCEELLLAEMATRSAYRTRLNAGMLCIPEELSPAGPVDPTMDEGDGEATEDPLLRDLVDHMGTPIQDEGSAAALVPYIFRAKADLIDKIKHIDFNRQLDEHLEERTERSLKRLAQGLNVPVEIVTGLADVNHWTAWQVEESAFAAHIEPLALMIVVALTVGYLHPMLAEADVEDVERFVIWYDASRLIRRTNVEDKAQKGHEAFIISDESYRRALGFGDEDKPSAEEIQARVERARARQGGGESGSDVTTAEEEEGGDSTRPLDPTPDTDEPVAAAGNGHRRDIVAPGGLAAPDDPKVSRRLGFTAGARVPDDLGRRLGEIDRMLYARLEAGVDATMRRALERAGANIRSRARKDRTTEQAVAQVGNDQVAATLGPQVVATLGVDEMDLLSDAFDGLAGRFDRWCTQATDAALELVPDMDPSERTIREQRFAEFRSDAWDWLRQTLVDRAVDLLYDPDPDPPEQGEFDDTTLVDFGIIREAVARAGGATSSSRSVTAGLGDLAGAVLGIATGWVAREVFRDHGVQTEGYEWTYGPFPRQNGFVPHQQLDGVQFVNFDDPELANNVGWPPEAFFIPGDHAGCMCDFTPIMIDVGG